MSDFELELIPDEVTTSSQNMSISLLSFLPQTSKR